MVFWSVLRYLDVVGRGRRWWNFLAPAKVVDDNMGLKNREWYLKGQGSTYLSDQMELLQFNDFSCTLKDTYKVVLELTVPRTR